MGVLKYLTSVIVVLLLFACSNGASRVVDNSNYGDFQGYKQITLGGTASSSSISVGVFQNYVESMVCPGINLTGGVLDSTFVHTGQDICNINESYLNDNQSIFGATSNHLNDFISNNPLGVSSVSMYQIRYNTQGQSGYYDGGAVPNQLVSGLVIVPNGIPLESIQGVVLYYHQTALSKFNVPSYQDVYSQITLASIYASQGYIVVAPDYVGQGVDSNVMHPYVLYPQNNALAGINMLKATRQFLAREKVINTTGSSMEALPFSMSKNLYITSYSEGGAYALWASRMLQGANAYGLSDSNLNLARTIGVFGAYDLSGAMIPYAYTAANNSVGASNTYNISPGVLESSPFYLAGGGLLNLESGLQQAIANLNMANSKAALASYAFVAFVYYNFTHAAYPQFFPNSQFFNMSQCLDLSKYLVSAINPTQKSIVESACIIQDSLPNLFMNTGANYNDTNIALTIGASAMYNTGFFTNSESATIMVNNIYGGGVSPNSVGNFAAPVLSDQSLMNVIKQADTWSYATNTKTSIVYLSYDSVVTNLDSLHACSSSGVYGLSPTGMVSCVKIDNSNLYSAMDLSSYGFPFQLALMLDHGTAFYIANLAGLNQIRTNQ